MRLTLRLAALGIAGPALAAAGSLALLDDLAPGTWELRNRSGAVVQRLCISQGRQLLQLRHPGTACETFGVESTATSVTVQYSCPGRGHARTRIRRETNRLIQIESQGIADGVPFEVLAEARRVASC